MVSNKPGLPTLSTLWTIFVVISMEVAPKQSHCLKQNILVVMLLVKNLLRSSFFFYLNIKTSPDQEARNLGIFVWISISGSIKLTMKIDLKNKLIEFNTWYFHNHLTLVSRIPSLSSDFQLFLYRSCCFPKTYSMNELF